MTHQASCKHQFRPRNLPIFLPVHQSFACQVLILESHSCYQQFQRPPNLSRWLVPLPARRQMR